MIRIQDIARENKNLQDNVLSNLQQQLKEATGLFKGKERKTITAQIQQTEEKSPTSWTHCPKS